MAEKKSGPVKPPIIDATPRREGAEKRAASGGASGARPEPSAPASASATPASATRPEPKQKASDSKPASATQPAPSASSAPRSDAAAASPASGPGAMSPLVLAGSVGGGALIGLALAYGVALAGWWPQPGALDGGEIAALEARTTEMERALAGQALERTALEDRLGAAEMALGQLSAAEAPSLDGLAAEADLDALSTRVDELASRLDAVAAGASAEDSTRIATELTGIAAQASDLSARLDALEPQVANLAPRIAATEARVDDLDTRIADQPAFEAVSAERDRVALLPSALGALERAVTSGQPFAVELAALEPLLPSLQISPQVRAVAASGADTDAGLLARFRAEIPDILAARPRDPEAGWAQTLLDQAASAIALRPTAGDTPQALVGRTEEALETGDVNTAAAAFAALPAPMQQAAPGFTEAWARTLAARDLLETIRAADPIAPATEASQ